MNEQERDLVERMHREAVQRHWDEKERQRDLMGQLHRAEVERVRQEHEKADELIVQMHRAAVEHPKQQLVSQVETPTLHYTELPEARSDSPLREEWDFYRRQVGRLLSEGHGGRHVLIKGEQLIGLWDTHDEALLAGYQRFAGQPFLVHQVQERERVLRCVNVWQWRNLRLR